jgi:serpin B
MKSLHVIIVIGLFPLLVEAGNPQGIAEGNNRFAFNLLKNMQQGSATNMICSPFSISTAMAMVYAGARTETASQIGRTMFFTEREKFHADYHSLLLKLDEVAAGKIKLNIANGLWGQRDFPFLDAYLDRVKSNYRSDLKEVDFSITAERESTRKDINAWVENKTNHKIRNILGPADLDMYTRLVLVNAIYFYGEWATPFEKGLTMPDDFVTVDGMKTKTPFMNKVGSFRYYEDSTLKALEIPYKDNTASMVILLPDKIDGIQELVSALDYDYFMEIDAALSPVKVSLSIPKFKTEYRIGLGNTLAEMGMPLAFSQDHADFSGMTGKRDLCISKVIHQAFIEVDEKGTEAAAATAVVMTCTSSPFPPKVKVFRANHPFVFFIRDNATGCILFMGRIMNPVVIK